MKMGNLTGRIIIFALSLPMIGLNFSCSEDNDSGIYLPGSGDHYLEKDGVWYYKTGDEATVTSIKGREEIFILDYVTINDTVCPVTKIKNMCAPEVKVLHFPQTIKQIENKVFSKTEINVFL